MTARPTRYAFWRGVATTVVVLFVLWLSVGVAFGYPQAVECVKDNRGPAVDVDVESYRKWGYFRTFEVGACTAYWHRSEKDEHFR
jgi:hypothetical protein